jgi:UDP-N-acetylglucosamine 2-epimerase (non-hydrolysing)
VVGARPNFMKIAPIVDALKKFPDLQHCLVHSGQHYDELLSGSFFTELGLPRPDVNLQVGSGTHAAQTAEVMKRLESVLLDYQSDVVVVGDVNSTLATAITAVKLGIRVAHVEAGLRSFDGTMPEEISRKLTDAISDLLFVTEQSGIKNLRHEGIPAEKIFLVGNVMIDTLLRHRELAASSPILDQLHLRQNGSGLKIYGVLTLHRPSNVDDPQLLSGILTAVNTSPLTFQSFPGASANAKEHRELRFGTILLSGSAGILRRGPARSSRLPRFSHYERSRPPSSHRLWWSARRNYRAGRALPDAAGEHRASRNR